MNFYADSTYIHAKIYALHSQLLARSDYYEMAKSGNLQRLNAGIPAVNIKNDYIKIKESIFDSQISRIISLAEASESYRRVFILFLRYFEILNLKLLYAKAYGRNPSPSQWYDIGGFSVLDRDMLSDKTGVATLLKYSKNTWMRDILTTEDAGSYEQVEFSIDRAALRLATEFPYSMNFMHGADSIKIISGLAAYFRIVWSWRLQYIYLWDAGSIKKYMNSNVILPENGRALYLSVAEWERILTKHVHSGDGAVMGGGCAGIMSAEKIMERVLIRDFSKTFHENFHSINTVVCYLALHYRQIRNLFSLVDGLRFGLEPDMIMENIICEG